MTVTTPTSSLELLAVAAHSLTEPLAPPSGDREADRKRREKCYHERTTLWRPGTTAKERKHDGDWWGSAGWTVFFTVGALILGAVWLLGELKASSNWPWAALAAVPIGCAVWMCGYEQYSRRVFQLGDDHDLRHAWDTVASAHRKISAAVKAQSQVAGALAEPLTDLREETAATIYDIVKLRASRTDATTGVLGAPEEVLQARWATRDARASELHAQLHRQATLALASAWAVDADMDVVHHDAKVPGTNAADRLEAVLNRLS